MSKKEKIEKGEKWAIGMTKDYQGKTYVVHGFNSKGNPLWRLADKNKKNTSSEDGKSSSSTSKTTKTDTNVNTDKKASYDAPKPNIEYKNKKPADGVVYEVPETWQAKNPKTGQIKTFHRSAHRKMYADKNKMPDDVLLKILNNHNNKPEIRQLAYEEAMARGIPEDKIDVSGRLQEKWDSIKFKNDLIKRTSGEDVSEEEYEDYDVETLRGMDVDAFIEENFPNGDEGWKSKDNPIIQAEFNKFRTLADRQRYDAFLDYQNRKDPFYDPPKAQIQDLAVQLLSFIDDKSGPLMVSAGGAGAGKTTALLKVAAQVPATIFDPKRHKPGDGDYDIYLVEKDIDDEKEFRNILAEHNGKIIVFDDKDKLLTSTASSNVSLMKSIADGNPDMRLFKNPKTGEQDKFTGQLLFVTNKTMDTLNKDEDHKAIMSRAIKHDIHFTVNETIDVLRDRYKTIGDKMKNVSSPQEEAEIRENVFNIIINSKDKIDPDKFTVRKFSEALKQIDAIIKSNKRIEEDSSAEELFGGKKSWERKVIQILNKAEDELMFKAVTSSGLQISKKTAKKMKKRYEEDPEGFIELFGEKILKVINQVNDDEKEEETVTEEDIVKAITDSGMSVSEAENILFG